MSRSDEAERGGAEPIDVEFEPADRGHRGGGVSFGAAFFMALLAAGAGAAGGALAPRVPEVDQLLDRAIPDGEGAGATQQIAQLAETNTGLETRVATIESVLNTPLAEAASAGPDGANVAARVFALQGGLRDVQTQLSALPSSTEVSALVTEVQQMEQQLPAIAAESRAAIEASRAAFAVAAAMEASQKSGPFEESYASLQALLPEDQNIAALGPLARTGAPTTRELREEFEGGVDTTILRAARVAQAGTGFWGRLQAETADWIIVTRTGQTRADTPDGVVELARERLAAEDLQGAVEAVSRLSGPSRQAADDWLAKAQRRLAIDQHLRAVRTELSRRG